MKQVPSLRVDLNGPAQARFEAAARAAGFDPGDRWVGGYASYEWDHLRLALAAYGIEVAKRDVLEFGCNVGGSSVVLAALGAKLCGVDIDPNMVALAEANLARHGLSGTILPLEPRERLPFPDCSFDIAVANSVLEYVDGKLLGHAISELHRILRPGGILFICGTASRLALRERHSGRLFVNFLPESIDRVTGYRIQRGLSPFRLARVLDGRFSVEGRAGWAETRRAIHGRLSLPMKFVNGAAALFGIGPGWISPHLELVLRKR